MARPIRNTPILMCTDADRSLHEISILPSEEEMNKERARIEASAQQFLSLVLKVKKIVKIMANNAAVYGMSLTIALLFSGCIDSIRCFYGASSGKPENNNEGVTTFWGSDIPVSWIKDVIIVCLSIFVLVLFVKVVVWMVRTIDRHCCSNYKKVLKEAVNITRALMEGYKNHNRDQTGEWLRNAYISLGRIETVRNNTFFFHYKNKRRMKEIYIKLEEELSKCNITVRDNKQTPDRKLTGKDEKQTPDSKPTDKDRFSKELIANSWQHVNEAIAEYLK